MRMRTIFILFISPICVHESIQLKSCEKWREKKTNDEDNHPILKRMRRMMVRKKKEYETQVEENERRRKKHINKLWGSKTCIYTCYDACTLWPLFAYSLNTTLTHSHYIGRWCAVSFASYPHETDSIEHHHHTGTSISSVWFRHFVLFSMEDIC